jgi:hypothetical protein
MTQRLLTVQEINKVKNNANSGFMTMIYTKTTVAIFVITTPFLSEMLSLLVNI